MLATATSADSSEDVVFEEQVEADFVRFSVGLPFSGFDNPEMATFLTDRQDHLCVICKNSRKDPIVSREIVGPLLQSDCPSKPLINAIRLWSRKNRITLPPRIRLWIGDEGQFFFNLDPNTVDTYIQDL